ncbi:TRAP transporter substrate-binding protein [Reichenbachiella versicolor]|uniref:TRAP transporter substrate-binding protein n=1 Tax=Reichenbachiella versicolor TaxID=1821036 RepID=UPI001FE59746|nr:TRAP transporter substrate-binding protein [Reichenbachiella versicolor]
MMTTKWRLSIQVLVVLCIGLISCQRTDKVKTLKLAHGLNDQHPVHLGILEMARLLEEISNGQMTIDIYSNGQLGQERDLLELLQIGSMDMTKVSAGALENFVPEISVLALPYIFRDSAHAWQVLQGGVGKQLLEKGSDYRLRGLCFYDAGSRSFYSKEKPFTTPEDLKGKKIRVMNSQSSFDMVNALGGSPTPVSFGELYTALQQGVVDAAENNPPSFFTSRHYEVCKYYSIDEHMSLPDVLIVGTYTWNNLTNQEKEWLQEAADRSVEYQKAVWYNSVLESLEAVKKAGVQVSYPDKTLFQGKVQNLYNKYKDQPKVYELIQQIQATGLSSSKTTTNDSKK